MSKKLKLIYVASATLAAAYISKGHAQRNPAYFDAPEKGVEAVVVVGDFPAIAEAYKAVEGCEVKVVAEAKPDAKTSKAAKPKGPTKAEQEAEAKRIAAERDAERKKIEEADQPALMEILVGLETLKYGGPHTIAIEDLEGLDIEALRAMAIEAVFIEV